MLDWRHPNRGCHHPRICPPTRCWTRPPKSTSPHTKLLSVSFEFLLESFGLGCHGLLISPHEIDLLLCSLPAGSLPPLVHVPRPIHSRKSACSTMGSMELKTGA